MLASLPSSLSFSNCYLLFVLKLNCGAAGFYRVHYSSKMREALLSGVRDASLPRFDRYAIVSDLFALVCIIVFLN